MRPEPPGAPSVSIVVNNYNYGRFLAEAIDSALAQSHPDVEVVVVDDGSTDGSQRIIARYGDRVRALLKENGGQASALNAGLAASTGDLVLFLDADDVLLPEAVERVVEVWRPGVAKVQFLLEVIDAEGAPRGTRLPPDGDRGIDARSLLLATGNYPSTGTTGNAFARSVLERLMPVPERTWRKQPDSYLVLLAPFLGDVVWLDHMLGRYRAHGGNQWTMDRLDLGRIREHLAGDELRDAALREWAPRLGISVPEDWLVRVPNHLQSRLTSLRLAPEAHPYAGDRPWRLALFGARASLRSASFSIRKRVFFALWFLLMPLPPQPLARRLAELGFLRGARSSWLQAIVA